MSSLKVIDSTKIVPPSENLVILNPSENICGETNFSKKVLKVGKTYYPITKNSLVPLSSIGINIIIRSSPPKIAVGDIINTILIEVENIPIKTLKIQLRPYTPTSPILFSEDEIRDYLISKLKNYPIFPNQTLFFNYENNKIVGTVDSKQEIGYISPKTEFLITSPSSEIVLSTSSLLKREIFKDTFSFEDLGIGGLDSKLRDTFKQALSSRAISSSLAKKLKIRHVRGMLLYGPPGCGKSLIARKISGLLSDIPPKIINGPEVMSKYVGQSEENIRSLFTEAQSDKSDNLHIIIFDEIDAICKTRGTSSGGTGVGDNIVNQLLTMIDGVNSIDSIFVIGMTNRKDLIDEALLRAGRLELHVEINLPDISGREQIFRIHTPPTLIGNDVNLKGLAQLTPNFSGAEIQSVVNRAISLSIHKSLQSKTNKTHQKSDSSKDDILEEDLILTKDTFTKAINSIQPIFGARRPENYIPQNYIENISESHSKSYQGIISYFTNSSRPVRRLLLKGEPGTGKTVLAAKVACDISINSVRMFGSSEVGVMDENQKITFISRILNEMTSTNDSLLIIDDIEVVIGYTRLSGVITFSNRVLQSIITLLKTTPKHGSKISIMIIGWEENLLDNLNKYFDKVETLGYMEDMTTVREYLNNSI